jgi:hypothetical protein
LGAKGRKRAAGANRSVKSTRLLARLGVEEELAAGEKLVTVEPTFLLSDGRSARLAFERDEERQLCVGYAIEQDGTWHMEEAEPFSMRTLGYYRRRLRRIGEREPRPGEEDWDDETEP